MSCLSGVVLTTWSSTRSKQWRWSWTSGEPPLTIMSSTVTALESFRFLGTTISQDLKWNNHIESMVKKAQQQLYFPFLLRKFNLSHELLIQLYSAIIESVLVQLSFQIWPQKTTEGSPDCKVNHWYTLPTLQELYLSRVSNRAGPLTSSTLPLWTVTIWSTLQSTRTTRHRNSFFPQAIHLMNT